MCGLWNYTKLQLLLQHILSCYRWKYDILKFLWRSCSPKPGWVMPKLFARVCVWKGFMRVVVPSKGRPSSYDLVAYMNTIAASNPSFLPSTTTTAALSSLITWSCLEKFRYVVRVNQRTLNNGLSYLHMIWTIGKKCLTAFNIQCIMKVEIGRSKLCCLSSESSSKHKRKCRCHRLVFFEMTFHLCATQPTGVVILVFLSPLFTHTTHILKYFE